MIMNDNIFEIDENNILIQYKGNDENVIIPENIVEIGGRYIADDKWGNELWHGAFNVRNARNIKSIIIPDSVTVIGDYAFEGCASLKSITFPDSVTKIGDSAFASCESLEEVIIPNGITRIEYDVFSYCCNLKNAVIPDSVTKICGRAFFACVNLENITIPDSVTDIDMSSFKNCDNLVIHCTAGSYAEQYAKINRIPCEIIEVNKGKSYTDD